METVFIIASLILYLSSIVFFKKIKQREIIILFAGLFHLSALIFRTIAAGHIPLSNLYETLLFFPFLLAVRLIIYKKQLFEISRIMIILSVMFLLSITFFLPDNYKAPRELPPALNSVWILIHVPSYFIGYVSVLLSFIYSLNYAYRAFWKKEHSRGLMNKIHREVKISFLFLSAGLISGAIWAHYSWGDYWSWDPKETWALINILILSLYFIIPRSNHIKLIIIAFTFLSLIFTYWGVPFILEGLHSY